MIGDLVDREIGSSGHREIGFRKDYDNCQRSANRNHDQNKFRVSNCGRDPISKISRSCDVPIPRSLMPCRPLRIIFRSHDQAIAHMNDTVADFGCLGIMRDHQHGLAKLLVGVAQHLQHDI